jgi:filamentous hemagglutinin family protein
MNALCYKIVFSKRLGALVAVGEHTVGQGKTASGSGVRSVVNDAISSFIGALSATFAAVALTFLTASFTASVGFAAGPAVNALPTGASVNSGSVAISSTAGNNAAVMNITQTTDKASVNWQSFNIGSAARVNVQQNSASSVLLNRVVGNDPSQIFGKLSANGQVVLINPNGIVFGSGGSVTASAFTASAFGINEQDFASGKYKYTRTGSTAGVTVQDGATLNATAPGGYIALIGASVDNQGRISTKQGAVVLAAGESITLPAGLTNNISVPLSGKVRLELLPSTINAMVSNSGTITTEGGQVLMQAAALSDAVASITHTGTIDTTGDQGGAVTLLADGGVIKATGSIKANSTAAANKGGDIVIGRDEVTGVLAKSTDVSGAQFESKGGFVETSGDWLATYGTKVKAKDWLLDPYNINIVGTASGTAYIDPNVTGGSYVYAPGVASNIRNVDIQNSLNDGTNVKISTGLGSSSSGTDVGNIYVGANIAKTLGGDAKLTLEANNAITFGGGFKITGNSTAGKLDVSLIAKGGNAPSTSSGGVYVVGGASGGGIDTNGKVVIDSTSKYIGGWDFTKAALAMGAGSIIKGSDVDIKLNVDFNNSATAYRVYGAFLQNDVKLEATAGNLSIDSKISAGSKSNLSNAILVGSGYGNASILKATGGNVSLTADWSGNTGGGGGITTVDTAVSATGNILVDSKVFGDGMSAIAAGNGGSGKGFSAVSTGNGDVTFTANKGAIELKNLTTKIKGKDVTFNNGSGASGTNTGVAISGQGIDATGKIYIKGAALGSGVGVNVAGAYTTTTADTTGATTNQAVYIEGTSATGNGVQVGSITANNGSVSMKGKSLAGTGSGIAQTGAITAKSITMTGNSVAGAGVTSMGVLTATGDVRIEGTSTASTSSQGISVANNITGGSVYLKGISGGSTGVDISAAVKSTSSSAGDITVIGEGGATVSNTSSNQGVWVRSAGSIDSAGKADITGSNSNAFNNLNMMGTFIQGTVKAAGDINLEGHSTSSSSPNHGLVINNTVTSTGGNIKATASAANGQKVALLISGGGELIANGLNKNITMVANTMDFSGATATSAINAGATGTVNITTKDAGIAIKVGLDDSWPLVQQLSLNQTELNKITAAKTVIGDSLNTGGISVDGAVTTATAAGNITLHTGGNITVNKALTIASTKTLTLNGAGASSTISQANTDAGITADSVLFLGNNATVTLQPTGTTANSANKIGTIAGDVKSFALTNQRDLTVGAVNGTNGLKASNDIKLTTTTLAGTALNIVKNIESTTGNVEINATTSETFVPLLGRFAAVTSSAEVKGKDITMNAFALGTTGKTLGYYGAAGPTVGSGFFTASNNLSLKGSTQNEGNGFYMWKGALSAGNTLSIEGTSAQGQGVGFDGSGSPTNVSITSAKGITIKGNALSTGQAAINLKDVNLTNNISGAVTLEAMKGDITTSGTGTLTQSGNGGVKLTTVDAGNITVPKIINRGTGDVVIAAGSNLAVGDGTGGQVKTNADSKVTQSHPTNPGNTYLYTGNANDTDPLSTVGGFANGLFLSTIGSDIVNAASNTAYETSGTRNSVLGGANTQVMFREKVALSGALNNAVVTYGDSTGSAAVKAALQATNPASGSSNIISTTSNAGTFKILNADLIADMATGKPSVDTALSLATNKSTSGNLKANSAGYNVDIAGTKYTLNTTAKLVVNQKSLTALYAANDKVFDGNTNATVTGSLQNTITGDLVSPTNTNATFDTAAVGTNKLVRITGISLAGFDAANYKIDLVANPTFTATATADITPIAPKPPAPVVPTGTTSGGVKIPLSAANPFQLASAEELGGEDFCQNTSIDPLKGESSGNSTSSCTCEESKLAQDAQICFETNTQKISVQ